MNITKEQFMKMSGLFSWADHYFFIHTKVGNFLYNSVTKIVQEYDGTQENFIKEIGVTGMSNKGRYLVANFLKSSDFELKLLDNNYLNYEYATD